MTEFRSTILPFFTTETGEASIRGVTCNDFKVPIAFLRNCGTWEGTAKRVTAAGDLIDEHLVRVEITIDGTQYVQTNTVRIDTPREVTAHYFGTFEDGKLVFPLTDEVYTLGGEKASGFSGIAWAITDEMIVYCGSRTVQGCKTHYNELITLSDRDPQHNNETNHRIRTTQLFEDGIYKLVTMIEEIKVAS
ncbi:MAG: hypothetical protein SFY66_27225 [Oculatellaceae cyanobacterium bins.114]|nr:hypothetical protein [Oculatellaceae cyanobacterium bins.114]